MSVSIGLSSLRLGATMLGAIAAHPRLWLTAIRQVRVLTRPRWWANPPFLPVPDPAYLRFRMVTAYGGSGSGNLAMAEPSDIVAYLSWCRVQRTLS